MSSSAHRSRLTMGAIIVMSLLLLVGACFLAMVYHQVQANRTKSMEFEDFISYGTPIPAGTDALGNRVSVVLTESRVDKPVFANVTLASHMKYWWREWSLAAEQVLQDLRSGNWHRSQATPAP
ncbi:hypothetical protein [Roseimicrobium sp. ORNL1]|uniref:hypothetical protein n=1 Tax=Roseimicrobium sp. ORNL1 TaxID=2711231 RepID=UPI0013E1182B|nr:hypothetical protein [Roseimicrobium sp. ORNL1]QIF04331.1 hypothetical protein G5S37_23335 [Roseimicrobium sp. ORNL1]